MKQGTNKVRFIPIHLVPKVRTVIYGRLVYDIRIHKEEKYRNRLTIGGDRVEYPYDVSTPISDLLKAKCLINSTLSTPNVKALVADIKDFYLNTEMDRFEYMRLKNDIILREIIDQYT